jgi:hypothetical protein
MDMLGCLLPDDANFDVFQLSLSVAYGEPVPASLSTCDKNASATSLGRFRVFAF